MKEPYLSTRKRKPLGTAKALRSRCTKPEIILWRKLRAHRFMHLKFRRQMPIDRFIVDFCCPEHWLVVELDGAAHALLHKQRDEVRDRILQKAGYRVLRIPNDWIYQSLNSVLTMIAQACAKETVSE